MELAGKIALVTGAARRVGKDIALGLAREGMHLAVHYHRSAAEAARTTEEIAALGVRASRIQGDLSNEESVATSFTQIEQEFGGLDVLVNSAGIIQKARFMELTPADWERNLRVNLTGPFLCIQRAARMMQARGGGAIVNISDIAAVKPWTVYAAQSVCKAGMNMLTQVAARALAPSIRVNAVMPGPVVKAEEMPDEEWNRYTRRLPLKRAGSGEDVAQAVIFLLKNDFISGVTLAVDGGNLLV